MNTIILITIAFNVLEQYNLAAKNEPNKEQIMQLLRDQATKHEISGRIAYKKFNHVGGDHKIYEFEIGGKPIVVEVRRMRLVQFEKESHMFSD